MASMDLKSADLVDGGAWALPIAHGEAGGDNRSPGLTWSCAPREARSYAVTCFDLDEPTGVGFVHWVMFNIGAEAEGLEPGVGAAGQNPAGSELGFTDWGQTGYGGPAPAPGGPAHRYQFTVYALDVDRLELEGSTTTYAMLQYVMRGHVLESAGLVGTFATPASH